MKKKLYRSRTDKKLAGVCGGIAEYFDIDATLVRLAVVILVVFAGTGLLAYIVAAIIIPVEPFDNQNQNPYNNQNPYDAPQDYNDNGPTRV